MPKLPIYKDLAAYENEGGPLTEKIATHKYPRRVDVPGDVKAPYISLYGAKRVLLPHSVEEIDVVIKQMTKDAPEEINTRALKGFSLRGVSLVPNHTITRAYRNYWSYRRENNQRKRFNATIERAMAIRTRNQSGFDLTIAGLEVREFGRGLRARNYVYATFEENDGLSHLQDDQDTYLRAACDTDDTSEIAQGIIEPSFKFHLSLLKTVDIEAATFAKEQTEEKLKGQSISVARIQPVLMG